MIQHKDIRVLIISNILQAHIYLQLQVSIFCTEHSQDRKKIRSVEIFKLSSTVSKKKLFFYIYIFLTVHDNKCHDLSCKLEIFKFFNVLKGVIYMVKRSAFLLPEAFMSFLK